MTASITLAQFPQALETQRLPPVHTLREGLDLYPGATGRGGEPTWTLHDPMRNKFFTLGWLEYEILQRWMDKDPAAIARKVRAATTLDATKEDVAFLDAFLVRNQLVRADNREDAEALRQQSMLGKPNFWSFILHRYLFFRIPLLHPDQFLDATLPFARLFFSRTFHWILLLLGTMGVYLALRQWSSFSQTFEYFFSGGGLVYFVLALFVTKCMHELGHAYTCKYYGLRVPTMGVAFLVMWPFLYTDTTESWKLASRRQRIVIGSAGMFAELIVAVIATLVWSFLPDGGLRSAVFFLATASWLMTLAININPFMRWDGYYILSDLLGIQNLQARAFALGKWRLREALFGFGDPPTEVFSTAMRRTLIGYAYATWIYRFLLFLGIALLVYYFFFKALGIFLMVVELVWFVGKPVYAEILEWHARRTKFVWNKNTFGSALLLTLVITALIFPWQHQVSAPAILQPRLHKTFYVPASARLVESYVQPNQSVTAGQLLFDLYSPELAFRSAEARGQIELYKASLARQGRTDFLERRDVVQRMLVEALTAYRGYQDQINQLKINAPFSGQIVITADDLTPNRWVADDLPLATLVDKNTLEVLAYTTEGELTRIRNDAPGYFYPENPRLEPVRLSIDEIDGASTTSLADSVLASTHGGPISTHKTPAGEIVPRDALYRIRMSIEEPHYKLPSTILRGTVHIEAESESWLKKLWIIISGVLIRESSF